MIEREETIAITPTPEEIAMEFASMSSSEQAIFFNEIARITKKWGESFCFQLQDLANRPELSADGKRIMEQIGEYGSSCPH